MAVNIRDTVTADGKKFEKLLKELGQLEVRIGIQQGETSKDGVDLVDIAMFNELGTVHIPSRPFLRDSVDANGDQINHFLQSMKKEHSKKGWCRSRLSKAILHQIQRKRYRGKDRILPWWIPAA